MIPLNKPIRIVNKMNNMCMTKEGIDQIKVYSCNRQERQSLYIVQKSPGHYFIYTNNNSCLDILHQSQKLCQKVIHYKHHGNTNQIFDFIKTQDNFYLIKSLSSNLVLEIMGGIDFQGMNVVQNICYYNPNQMWKFEEIQ